MQATPSCPLYIPERLDLYHTYSRGRKKPSKKEDMVEVINLLRACLLMFSLLFAWVASANNSAGIFNVKDYGAIPDGKTDNTLAFMRAWNEACAWEGRPRLLITEGTFLVGPLELKGPCKSYITVQVRGVVIAPTDLSSFPTNHWIHFQYIDGLLITGGGKFDGKGASAWPHNQCHQRKCKPLPTSIKFSFVTNSVVRGITSINSKHFHILVFASHNMKLHNLKIIAPRDSPNTDGIHLDHSSNIKISRSHFGTGDDCISIGPGNSNVLISDVFCGPGHGISVGSLGKERDEGDVFGLTVQNCSLTGTTNGVRIKTWPDSPASTSASNFTFEDIVMRNVHNPIIIDQMYCPHNSCSHKFPSRVRISNIKFQNIKGTSATKVAMNLMCSEAVPCENVELDNIDLVYNGKGGATTSFCANAEGSSTGFMVPPSCLRS